MKENNGKLDVCYNVQTAVDSKSHLIADFTVTNNCNDMGLLVPMAEVAKKAMEVETLESLKNGIIPKVYEDYKISVEIIAPGEYTISEEVIENEPVENHTESIEKVIIEVNENFIRDRQTNIVTCPMGNILKQKSTVKGKARYANKLACRNCKCKCTIAAFKVVEFPENKDIVKSKFFAGKKTTAELSLSFLAYNMKRAINMIGVNTLISKMQVT